MRFFSKGLKNEFETAMVNEPSVFEPLKVYCALHLTLQLNTFVIYVLLFHINIEGKCVWIIGDGWTGWGPPSKIIGGRGGPLSPPPLPTPMLHRHVFLHPLSGITTDRLGWIAQIITHTCDPQRGRRKRERERPL